jgi:hypothetical protein
MNRPKMTFEEVRKLIPAEHLAEYPVAFVGIRGYFKKTMGDPEKNDIGIYDDAIFLVCRDGTFMACNGNTDPSRQRPGIATLVPGVHMYRKGPHGISRGRPYPAFRPANPKEELPVTRAGKSGIHMGVALNIHCGGLNTTSSEGCQTIHPEQWKSFQVAAYAALDKAGQEEFPYVLIET